MSIFYFTQFLIAQETRKKASQFALVFTSKLQWKNIFSLFSFKIEIEVGKSVTLCFVEVCFTVGPQIPSCHRQGIYLRVACKTVVTHGIIFFSFPNSFRLSLYALTRYFVLNQMVISLPCAKGLGAPSPFHHSFYFCLSCSVCCV